MALSYRLQRSVEVMKFLYRQRTKGFDVPDEPHFDPQATRMFVDRLKNANRYLEFGSGGSTVVAAKFGVDTITVENDRFFARSVVCKIGPHAKNKMFAVNVGVTLEWGYPMIQKQTAPRLKRWAEYIQAPFRHIDSQNDKFPDLILVDGRFRRACALASAQKALARGESTVICFDDYAGRDWYHDIEAELGVPEMVGRMAVFTVQPGQPAPSDASLQAAMRDVR